MPWNFFKQAQVLSKGSFKKPFPKHFFTSLLQDLSTEDLVPLVTFYQHNL
jgi:hypothetical protein